MLLWEESCDILQFGVGDQKRFVRDNPPPLFIFFRDNPKLTDELTATFFSLENSVIMMH